LALTATRFEHAGGTITADPDEIQLIAFCVPAISNEIGYSRTEVEVVTGLPYSVFESVVARLAQMQA
jgi:hypothetical protein